MVKNPKTDSGVKKSAKGLPKVIKQDGSFVLVEQGSWEDEAEGELQLIFENGNFFNHTTLAEARTTLAESA